MHISFLVAAISARLAGSETTARFVEMCVLFFELYEIFITQTKKYATEIADMIKKLSMRMYDMAGERYP